MPRSPRTAPWCRPPAWPMTDRWPPACSCGSGSCTALRCHRARDIPGHDRRGERRHEPPPRRAGRALAWNRQSNDATLPDQSPAGVAQSVTLPVNTWQCIEFEVNSANGDISTWVNGTSVPGLTEDGIATPNVDDQWLAKPNWRPRLTDLNLGWESYASETDILRFDDVRAELSAHWLRLTKGMGPHRQNQAVEEVIEERDTRRGTAGARLNGVPRRRSAARVSGRVCPPGWRPGARRSRRRRPGRP